MHVPPQFRVDYMSIPLSGYEEGVVYPNKEVLK